MPIRPCPGDRQILKAFAEQAPGGIGFAILAALLAHADENFIAWPGYGTIARIANVSTRTVERWIPKLESAGFFRRRKVESGARRDRTVYDMSGFIQRSFSLFADTESVLSSRLIPTERRPHTDSDAASMPTGGRTKEPKKNPAKEPLREKQSKFGKVRSCTRCPHDFEVTEDLMGWAMDKFPTINLSTETDAFRDHEFARARTDWPAAWRNWIRRASAFNGGGNAVATKKSQASDTYHDEIRRAADDYDA